MMDVVLGVSLDALQGPSTDSRFNAPTLGPSGFLDLLESHLGLSAPEVPRAQRVAVYLSCLQSVGTGRFYADSLVADAMGTAARLLAWRDEWRMGGWLGQPGHEPRIRDMAAVEEIAARELPPGEAERLEAVLLALRSGARVPVATVTMVDDLALFPLLWQQVLALLPCAGNASSAAHSVNHLSAQGTGELRRVQDAALQLCQGDAPPDALSPVADGSLLVVRALSASTAEHWLSQRLQREPADRLILAESLGDQLDGTLAATGASRCGFTSASPLRPALQCLSLAMALCWEPLDIHALVEFLAHPVGPISRTVRKQLLRVVAQKPGIGGDDWQAAKLALDEDSAADQAEAKAEEPGRWSELLTYWLECPRWPQQDGAPIDQLAERATRLGDVMQQRLALAIQKASGDASVFAAAARQCADVAQALHALRARGVECVNPRTLEQVIAFATPAGASDPASVAQVGCVRSSSSPAACIEPADEVIWWMPSAPNLVAPLPWREEELSCLRDLNVRLRNPDLELKAVFAQWMRPLLAARKRFVLVLPTGDAEVHPIRQVLALLVQRFGTQVFDLDLPEVQQQIADEVPAQPLPTVPESLHVGRPVPLDQPTHSFTSLGDLFHSPALFALRRSARLKGMDLPSVEENRRLLGTLAHRLIEKLFAQDGVLTWSVEQVQSWLKPALSQLVKEEGAVLLMPGASVSLARFQARCEQALPTLLILLREASAVRVQTEVDVKGCLFDVPMVGSVDLLVQLADGRTLALDTKWGRDKDYAKAFATGDYLQLAIYAKLLEQQTGQEPCALGYFVFDTGNLYISAPDVVPGAIVRVPPPEVAVAALLNQAQTTWGWRAGQFKAGQVDVPPPKPGDEWNGPDGTLAMKGPKPWDHEYLITLGGWQ